MKKIILAALFLLLAFYVGWPLWSAYQIRAALDANDVPTLERKVDFASVRASMKPVVTAEVERVFDRAGSGGVGQILGGALKQQLAPQLVETVLAGVITPERLGELYQYRGDIKEFLAERAARKDARKEAREAKEAGGSVNEAGIRLPGGLSIPGLGRKAAAGGDAQKEDAPPTPSPAGSPSSTAGAPSQPPREKPGLANVKRVAMTGPLALEIGVARDKAASVPDLTAQLAFTGFDWKLVGLVPRVR